MQKTGEEIESSRREKEEKKSEIERGFNVRVQVDKLFT